MQYINTDIPNACPLLYLRENMYHSSARPYIDDPKLGPGGTHWLFEDMLVMLKV